MNDEILDKILILQNTLYLAKLDAKDEVLVKVITETLGVLNMLLNNVSKAKNIEGTNEHTK